MDKNAKVIFRVKGNLLELYKVDKSLYCITLNGVDKFYFNSGGFLSDYNPYICNKQLSNNKTYHNTWTPTEKLEFDNWVVYGEFYNNVFRVQIFKNNNHFMYLFFRRYKNKMYLLLDGMELVYKDVLYSLFNDDHRTNGYDEYVIIDKIYDSKNGEILDKAKSGFILKSDFVLMSELGVLIKQHIKEKLQKIGAKVKINEIETKRYSSFMFKGSPAYIENGKVYYKGEVTHRIGGWAEDCFSDLYANYLKNVARKLYKRLKSNKNAKKVIKSVLSGKKITYWLYAHPNAEDTFILKQDGKVMLHLNESSLKEE